MSLTDELNKPEYQSGSHAERFALLKSKTTPTVGRIEQGNLKVLEAMIAKGLWRDKMVQLKAEAQATLADPNATAEAVQLANIKIQVVAGFNEAIAKEKLANKAPADDGGHSVNLGDPLVQQTFGAAQMAGINMLTAQEAAKVMELATFQRQLWPEATLRDVVAHFEPTLVDVGDWRELDPAGSTLLRLKLHEKTPEPTYIMVQMREDDGGWGEWFHLTGVHGIQALRSYTFQIPYNRLPRQIRWRGGLYAINGTVTAV